MIALHIESNNHNSSSSHDATAVRGSFTVRFHRAAPPSSEGSSGGGALQPPQLQQPPRPLPLPSTITPTLRPMEQSNQQPQERRYGGGLIRLSELQRRGLVPTPVPPPSLNGSRVPAPSRPVEGTTQVSGSTSYAAPLASSRILQQRQTVKSKPKSSRKTSSRSSTSSLPVPVDASGNLYEHRWYTARGRRVFVYHGRSYKGKAAHKMWEQVKRAGQMRSRAGVAAEVEPTHSRQVRAATEAQRRGRKRRAEQPADAGVVSVLQSTRRPPPVPPVRTQTIPPSHPSAPLRVCPPTDCPGWETLLTDFQFLSPPSPPVVDPPPACPTHQKQRPAPSHRGDVIEIISSSSGSDTEDSFTDCPTSRTQYFADPTPNYVPTAEEAEGGATYLKGGAVNDLPPRSGLHMIGCQALHSAPRRRKEVPVYSAGQEWDPYAECAMMDGLQGLDAEGMIEVGEGVGSLLFQ